MYITENGCAINTGPDENDVIDDQRRIRFHESYLKYVKKAMDAGCDIRGYFLWSFMDNFEWSEGYEPRFGLVYIDYDNDCRRLKKNSYHWYKEMIAKEQTSTSARK